MRTEVWFAPGRANLMGERADYNEGFVLPFALAQGVTATASARDGGLLVLRSRQLPDEPVTASWARSCRDLSPGGRPTRREWRGHCGAAGHPRSAVSIDIDSTYLSARGCRHRPPSSARRRWRCARFRGWSCRGGNWPRSPGGRKTSSSAPDRNIDQSAALLAGRATRCCSTARRFDVTHVPFRPDGGGRRPRLIVDTRVPHALVSMASTRRRRAECETAARLLGTPALGEVTLAMSPSLTGKKKKKKKKKKLADPVLRRRARHVISDSGRARAIRSALLLGNGRGDPACFWLPVRTGF